MALAVTQTNEGFGTAVQFDAANTFSASVTSAVPGDPVAFTVTVTNTGSFMRASADMQVTNNGTVPFVWGSYQATMEYQAPVTGEWIAVAKTSFDANGVQTDDPPLLHMNIANFVGTTIAPSQTVGLDSTENVTLAAELVNLLGDPAEASQVRVELHIDTGSGTPGVTADRDITGSFTDGQTTATNFGAGVIGFASNDMNVGVPLTASTTVVPPGGTVTFTGSAAAPALDARVPTESDSQYLRRLSGDSYEALLNLDLFATGNGRLFLLLLDPILNLQKSGPAQGNAGFTLPYTVALQNVGTATAGPLTVTDTVSGNDVGAQITAPASIAVGGSGTASINAASPLGQAPGAYTDQASVTWQDRNGNVYGPISSTFTTNLGVGHPEGYLTLSASGVTAAQIIGTSATLTATALDALGNPVANLPVQLVITGSNPQTVPLVTGADGTATFTYDGPNLGTDSAKVTATINGPTLQATAQGINWATSVGAPCTGRATPLDVMLVVDGSPSMFSEDTVVAAKAAAAAFINDLDLSRDQVGGTVFSGFATLDAPLTHDGVTAASELNASLQGLVDECTGFCGGGSNYNTAFQVAQNELQGPRHRPEATPVIIFLSDGGNTGPDYTAELAAIKGAGIRVISLGFGSSVNVVTMRSIASSPNDYFYAPSATELGWAYGNIDQDTCRTVVPLVSAGGNQGLYEVRLPSTLTLQGEAHGGGPRGDLDLTSTWTEVSGPAPVAFADASSPVTNVLFTDPGTYVLQLEVSDGFLTTASRVTVTVDPAPSLQAATFAVALSSPGPLAVGTPETLTATLTDAQAHPIGDFAVQVTVTGANPIVATLTTNASGVASFMYTGAAPGTDTLQATAYGGTAQLAATPLTVTWTAAPPGSGSGIVAQGWLGSPGQQTTVRGLVPITVASSVTVASGSLTYWPANAPTDTHVLTANAQGGPGSTLATLDTTTLPNGGYIIDLAGTDNQGNQQDSRVLVTVTGDYKPGREVVELTEFTVPVAGLPITVGRRYDSLNRDKVGDFGNGWALTVGHPDLQVDPGDNVTITMPNGRRVTFAFGLQPAAVGAIVLGFIATPVYIPEPGVFGELSSDGCTPLTFDPSSAPDPICFASLFDPTALHYAPTTYKYTDPYGVAYTMGADGTLKTIQDRNNNVVTFTPDGIVASTGGATVSFTRDAQGQITKILTPNMGDFFNTRFEYDYAYDADGNLISASAPGQNVFTQIYQYTYDGSHRLLTTKDPSDHPARISTFDDAGRLATDKDAMGNTTGYVYDVPGHTTTTTYPDTGVVAQKFDDNGMLLSETDQLGRVTKHEYDANRNETKRTNALNEVTTYTYDPNGNQTSSTKVLLNETTTTIYNAFSEPLTTTNPIGNTTTIAYDDNGLPTTFTDSMGLLATFTSSEHGLPLTVTDVEGKVVFLSYDAAGDLTGRTDRLGRLTSYQYDAMGRKTSMTRPREQGNQKATTYSYDNDGDLLLTANPLGFGEVIHFDANRNVQNIHSVLGGRQVDYLYDLDNHLSFTFNDDSSQVNQTADFRGNVLSRTDEAGHTTSYTYDLVGRLLKTTYADLTFTSQTYDELGRLASKTDERTNTTTYGYEPGCDCAERLTSVIDPLGRTTSMTYDGMGRKTSMTDANQHQTSYVYDLRGHLIETDYADMTATHDTYDARGRRTASKDQTQQTTLFGYDDEGQLTSVTDPLSHVTQYGYDPNGNLTSVTDANNQVTTYAYDDANRKISRTLPLGMTEAFGYDGNDNVVSHTDFRGKTATYGFDQRYPSGRQTSKLPDPSLGEPTVSYTYYTNGLRETMTDASGLTTYTYDQRDRLLTKATPEGTLTYTYDSSGNVASIDSSNANGTSVGYAWDGANQLSTVTDNQLAGMTTAAYTATGRPFTLTQPNGVGMTYGYDSLDRVTSMAWKKGTSPTFASFGYGYNLRGQRTSSSDVTGREAVYGYDEASRLTSETITGDPTGPSGNGALTYIIDPVGNRSSRTSTLATLGAQSFSYDANDELTNDGYDLNGNTTSSGGHTYGYDFENRLVSKDSGAVTVVYDGDGNRVAKSVGGVTTKYLVDALNPTGYLQVMDEVSGGAVQVRYTFGNTLVSQTRNPSAAPSTSFYGYDAHRNITFLTDTNGVVTDTYDYDAWGNLVASAGTTPNKRLYVGEEFDPDLGLINLRARQYQPSNGRFLTRDATNGDRRRPITMNGYLYANGMPVDASDPSGLDAAVEFGLLQVGIVQPVFISTPVTGAGAAAAAGAVGASAGLAVGVGVIVGQKASCNFQIGADLFAAGASESVVRVNPYCPETVCRCECPVIPPEIIFVGKDIGPKPPTPPSSVDGKGRGDNEETAKLRCIDNAADQLAWKHWNPEGLYSIDDTKCSILECWQE